MVNKHFELQTVRDEVSKCTRCPGLLGSRIQTVFGEGNFDADLMLVGEAPGATEAAQGVPFVGESGELLTNILSACGFRREDVFIANTLKCRPPNNRNPEPEELSNCRGYLDRQIDIIKPKYLLLLGSVASKNLLGEPVTFLRGRWHEYKGIPTVVTFHPSFILREGDSAKKEVGKDLRMLLKRMRE